MKAERFRNTPAELFLGGNHKTLSRMQDEMDLPGVGRRVTLTGVIRCTGKLLDPKTKDFDTHG